MSLTSPITFRWKGWPGVALFLAAVYVGGAATAMGVLSGGAYDPATVRGATWPSAVATMLTGLLVAAPIRQLALGTPMAVLLRAALAWGAVGAAWPVANTLSDVLTGADSAGLVDTATLIPLGALVGAVSGAVGGGLGAALALRRGAR